MKIYYVLRSFSDQARCYCRNIAKTTSNRTTFSVPVLLFYLLKFTIYHENGAFVLVRPSCSFLNYYWPRVSLLDQFRTLVNCRSHTEQKVPEQKVKRRRRTRLSALFLSVPTSVYVILSNPKIHQTETPCYFQAL